ncbi:MAG TPA: M48 family metallopeptidase [Paludibacteraceae bacterium]|nr:M48 family metallopeptidase [Paludibacteraceae bacterium]
MSTFIFYAVITILLLDFALGRTLSYLNIKASRSQIPDLLVGLYDEAKYDKQQRYFRTNAKFGWTTASFSFLLILCMYSFGGFAWVDGIARSLVENELLVSLVFFGILFFANDLLNIPFELYDIFVIETRFEFNKITPKIYIFDKLKGWGLSLVIGGGLATAIILIYQQIPDYFWLVAWAVVSAFGLFMSLFYSELIVPLFNKQTPLEAGELRDAIEVFAEKTDFKLKNIYVIDGSKRSTKANAYFTGWGRKKRIVLYDTLINELTTSEIVAVLAHEIGHNKHKHTIKGIILSLATNLIMFFLLGLILNNDAFAQALGCQQASFHINLLVFSILYTPLSLVLDVFGNLLSRKHEYQADAFVKANGYGEQLISALKKISSSTLSNLTPHPAFVFFHYSHPTLYQRVKALVN